MCHALVACRPFEFESCWYTHKQLCITCLYMHTFRFMHIWVSQYHPRSCFTLGLLQSHGRVGVQSSRPTFSCWRGTVGTTAGYRHKLPSSGSSWNLGSSAVGQKSSDGHSKHSFSYCFRPDRRWPHQIPPQHCSWWPECSRPEGANLDVGLFDHLRLCSGAFQCWHWAGDLGHRDQPWKVPEHNCKCSNKPPGRSQLGRQLIRSFTVMLWHPSVLTLSSKPWASRPALKSARKQL